MPESIGTRASEGCIRMNNEDLEQLVKQIYPPLVVAITPAAEDVKANLK
ncbi:MAG: L,D-transpeptidase [Bacteroides sp.]|nr:L,D-transpeptidase [Bacteroides sp.]